LCRFPNDRRQQLGPRGGPFGTATGPGKLPGRLPTPSSPLGVKRGDPRYAATARVVPGSRRSPEVRWRARGRKGPLRCRATGGLPAAAAVVGLRLATAAAWGCRQPLCKVLRYTTDRLPRASPRNSRCPRPTARRCASCCISGDCVEASAPGMLGMNDFAC
jgi:hypothetical protein